MQPLSTETRSARALLLGSVFVVAASGLVYELVAGAVGSYLLGDAVTQFSIVIGVFLCAMGLGSYLSRFLEGELILRFVQVEIALGLVGGLSSLAMFAASALLRPWFALIFYLLCAGVGVLVGMEIPLLVRIIRERGAGISSAVSDVLALDYVGALFGALLFPLVALPVLGLTRSSVVFGLLNIGAAAAALPLLERQRARLGRQVVAAALVLLSAFFASGRAVGWLEDLLYQDHVIYAESSRYQRVVLTRWRDDVRLYLDGHLQFSSVDEARYHESLVIPAMEMSPSPRRVLILGGGDGMAAREVLKYPSVERIDLVDLDPAVVDLARTRPELLSLNQGSLNDPRVTVHNADAMLWLEEARESWDVALVDLPDPGHESLARLYSTAFYALLSRRLAAEGVWVTQATSPFFAPSAFWCIAQTAAASLPEDAPAGPLQVLPYHVHVPSFGEWGFVMGGHRLPDPASLAPSVPTRFLNAEALRALFAFPKDLTPPPDLRLNRLDDPVLTTYYQRGWRDFNE